MPNDDDDGDVFVRAANISHLSTAVFTRERRLPERKATMSHIYPTAYTTHEEKELTV